tara:strand:+ start:2540 stop:2923 length:384 start_codon:yes stop_codon:yes gene_type:complete
MLNGTDIVEAKRIRRNYNRRLDYWTAKMRTADRIEKDENGLCEATRVHGKLCQLMGDKCVALRELGFRQTDEDESWPPKLVPITQEWIDEQRAKETELDRLRKAARGGDEEAARKFLRALSGSFENE